MSKGLFLNTLNLLSITIASLGFLLCQLVQRPDGLVFFPLQNIPASSQARFCRNDKTAHEQRRCDSSSKAFESSLSSQLLFLVWFVLSLER